MGINKKNNKKMKYTALLGLFAAVADQAVATEVAVGGLCAKTGDPLARPVCAGAAASPPTHCCASGKAADGADGSEQERCAAIAGDGAAQEVAAVTTPAVTAVTAVAANACSPAQEAGGSNVDGTCLPCAAAGQPAVAG